MKSKPLLILAAIIATTFSLNAQVAIPKLNSLPTARATLYMDFDGQVVKGTSWNWSGTIDAKPADLSETAIREIFNRVSEDYRPFNINVTTDSTVYLAAPFQQRIRIIVTPTSQWYGSAGGVAFVGSFTWGNETPGWVFSTLLYNETKVVAEAISHEAGHTFGLQHQSDYNGECKKIAEYGVGTGTGEIGWAPIMGVGYYKNLTTWHNGPNTIGCNSLQNDLAIIAGSANGFGYRTDDHSNSTGDATAITLEGQQFLVDGIINQTGDVDAFKVNISNTANFKLNAIPENVGTGNNGANVDIRIKILNSANDTIGSYNPSTLLDAGIDTTLNPGVYYVLVDGVGNANKSNYGSLGYYSMTGDLNIVLPVHQFKLKGIAGNSEHSLSWTFMADEDLKEIIVESSDNGNDFKTLATLDPSARSFGHPSLKPVTYYRLKAITEKAERAFLSNVISLKNNTAQGKAVQLFTNVITSSIDVKSNGMYSYQLMDVTGKLLAKGTLQNGMNNIPVAQDVRGVLFLRINDGSTGFTEKILKQ